jgi:hypothetical protein
VIEATWFHALLGPPIQWFEHLFGVPISSFVQGNLLRVGEVLGPNHERFYLDGGESKAMVQEPQPQCTKRAARCARFRQRLKFLRLMGHLGA